MALRMDAMALRTAAARVHSLKQRLEKVKDKAGGIVTTLVRTSEVGAAAFAVGVMNGKTGGVDVVGVPVELIGAAGVHLLGFLGVGGMGSHLHAFADGFLAAYLTGLGSDVGDGMNQPKPAKGKTGIKGSLEEGRRGRALDNDELRDLASQRPAPATVEQPHV